MVQPASRVLNGLFIGAYFHRSDQFSEFGYIFGFGVIWGFKLVQFPTTSPFSIKAGQNESNWENQLAGTIFLAVSVSIEYFINS